MHKRVQLSQQKFKFCFKNSNISALSGFSFDRLSLMMSLAALKALSLDTLVAGGARNLLANRCQIVRDQVAQAGVRRRHCTKARSKAMPLD